MGYPSGRTPVAIERNDRSLRGVSNWPVADGPSNEMRPQ
jgi:hypothetical protein